MTIPSTCPSRFLISIFSHCCFLSLIIIIITSFRIKLAGSDNNFSLLAGCNLGTLALEIRNPTASPLPPVHLRGSSQTVPAHYRGLRADLPSVYRLRRPRPCPVCRAGPSTSALDLLCAPRAALLRPALSLFLPLPLRRLQLDSAFHPKGKGENEGEREEEKRVSERETSWSVGR